MWRVQTGSRLHLGLLSLPGGGERWPDRDGQPAFAARRFGGVGLMIDAPGLSLRAQPAAEWSAEGPLAERALEFAYRAAGFIPAVRTVGTSPAAHVPPRKLVVERAPREHVGLGVGTQLGLSVARALAASWGMDVPVTTLARWVGRGRRSSLGVHGFEQGGFLVEAGKTAADDLSPLVARREFPEDWRIVFVVLPCVEGAHGAGELAAFERLTAPVATTEALCRLVLLGLLPALAERDLAAFGEAVFDLNARVGEMFSHAQGGVYSSAAVADLVAWFRSEGVRGVGQSSWGPGVFAFVGDEDRARHLARRVRDRLPTSEVHVARGLNHGHLTPSSGCSPPERCPEPGSR